MGTIEKRIIDGKTYVRVAGNKVVHPGSPPDIDTDFHTAHRDAAFEHVAQLYGADHSARLPTNQMLKTRASIKDGARVYGVPPAQANYVTSLLPDSLGITFAKVYNPESDEYAGAERFREAVSTPFWEKPLACAKALEGRIRGRGVHACGLLISSSPLQHHVPVDTAKDGSVVAGFEYGACESMGLIKFDFLGLDTVDILCDAARLAVQAGKDVPDFRKMVRESRFDDAETFRLLGKGDTVGIFQLGNSAVADLFTKFAPSTLGDISAITALYRPGPMSAGSHIQYVERRAGREEIKPIHADFVGSPLDSILADTSGLLVYQEQVMSIASLIAGMTPQEGDDLRRAIGKKKHDLMLAYAERFIEGGAGNGYSREAMQALWDRIVGFAEYGFNKSHSDAYAAMAYLALYMKAHFPAEFYAAAIARKVSMGSSGRDKVQELIEDAKRRGVRLDVPDVNFSSADIGLNGDGNLAFGFSMLKGVGSKDAEVIVSERERAGLYPSFKDFVVRSFNAGKVTKTTYEGLAKAGAFDVFGLSRKAVLEAIPGYLDLLRKERAKLRRQALKLAKETGVEPSPDAELVSGESLPEDEALSRDDYPLVERLRHEAEVAGQYMTGHPMASVPERVPVMRGCTVSELMASEQPVKGAVVMAAIVALDDKTHKKFGRKVIATLDDGTGVIAGYVSNSLLAREDLWVAEQNIKSAYINGDAIDSSDVSKVDAANIQASPKLQPYHVYSLHVNYTPARKIVNDDGEVNYRPPYLNILHARQVPLSASGDMCARLRVDISRGGSMEDVVRKVRKIVGGLHSADSTRHVPLMVALYDSSKPGCGVDLPSKFLYAAREGTSKGVSWSDLPVAPMEASTAAMRDLVDKMDYVEVPMWVPFMNATRNTLVKVFGEGSFDWGHFLVS